MKKSKTLRTLALGFVLGAACMVITNAIGASRTVSAIINDGLFFNINGELSRATDENPILNYNSRIYVPVRYIAEKLGCDVYWDAESHTVTVRGAEPTVEYVEVEKVVEVEKIVYVEGDDEVSGKKVYKKLPVVYKDGDFEIELVNIVRNETNDWTDAYINFTNKKQENVQLVQKDCKLTVDGEEYPMTDFMGWWDNSWTNSIHEDDEVSGYLRFDEMIEEDWSTGTLELVVRTIEQSGQAVYEDITINFKK